MTQYMISKQMQNIQNLQDTYIFKKQELPYVFYTSING